MTHRAILELPPAPVDRGRLLTPEEVAERLGRSPAWVRRNVRPVVRLGYCTVRVYEADLNTWIEMRREVSGSAT